MLFGLCLLVLIGVVFYWVGTRAEDLVITTTRANGRDLVDTIMLKTHFEMWETDNNKKEFVKKLIQDIEHQDEDYQYVILTADDTGIANISPEKRVKATDPSDIEMIAMLRAKLATQAAEEKALAEQPKPAVPTEAIEQQTYEAPPVFADRREPDNNAYYYYEPIYWEQSCKGCHHVSGVDQTAKAELPLRVIKVKIPYKPTQTAISWNRAILAAAAISTVFLAMAGLYVIVRYVIVKPLQHLRDVTDSISRGDLESRAEIYTNDEFADLAASFNKMLQHMTDAQSDLRNLNQDLDGKLDELAQLNIQLYEMNRLKGDFLANMSHELRTPLNSIIGFSDVLQGIDSLNDKQKRYARNIQKSGRLLLDMINDILDLAKMEAGGMEVRLTEFRIDAIIHAQCDMVRALTEEKNIDLEVTVQPETPPLFQDQVKVQQILTNLLSNAIKFTPEGGRIDVSAHLAKNGMLHISVADTGVGIPDEDREVIFEKFRQSTAVLGNDGLTREYSGTGLGLSIVKEICKMLGGKIEFESELGKGSTFTVQLPWTCANPARRDSIMGSRISDLTKPKRVDFKRLEENTPTPPTPATVSEDAEASS